MTQLQDQLHGILNTVQAREASVVQAQEEAGVQQQVWCGASWTVLGTCWSREREKHIASVHTLLSCLFS